LYERQVDVEGKAPNIQIASGSNATAALTDGMAKAMSVLFDDPAFVTALTKPAVTATPNS
jgi:hypothetical protein